jgi:DNA adenine methylase
VRLATGSRPQESTELQARSIANPRLKPLLRWAGGKQQLLGALLKHAPIDASTRRYFEPFLGAASLFLALQPKRAFLSDANALLIDFYQRVRDKPIDVSKKLDLLAERNCREFYYEIRENFNKSRPSIKKAAQFLYLNRTSFNGIYRVNKNGDYNVPFGFKPKPWFPGAKELKSLSLLLKGANLSCKSYEKALARAKKGDFIYLDPPYEPLSNTAYFAHYTAGRFHASDQLDLCRIVRALDKKGCLVMLSGADTDAMRIMYKNFKISTIDVRRYVTCKQRHAVQELIIRNY